MHARHRPRSVCAEIAELDANREGVDAVDLPPINDVVDADALETLAGDAVRVSFAYAGYEVVVDGDVRVRRKVRQ